MCVSGSQSLYKGSGGFVCDVGTDTWALHLPVMEGTGNAYRI